MKPAFRHLSAFVLLLPLLPPVFGSSSPDAPPLADTSTTTIAASNPDSDIICHGTTCYPRVFIPTEEFQIIHPDQEIPPGLHIRLNIDTGVREGKINVPGEGEEYEGTPVELPGGGGQGGLVIVGKEDAPAPSTDPSSSYKATIKADADSGDRADGFGAVKPPITAPAEEFTFTDSISILLSASSYDTASLNQALDTLENLVHESYWGLKLAIPENVNALLGLILKSTIPSVRSSSALVLGSALSNNPKALKAAITPLEGEEDVKLIETLLVSLKHEKDDSARARIMYALSQSIKSVQTYEDFVRIKGVDVLRELWNEVGGRGDRGEFWGKVSTFVEDNFLNEDMKTEAEQQQQQQSESQKHHHQPGGQQPLGDASTTEKSIDSSVKSFCEPLQVALVEAEKSGITDFDVQSKLLSLLVAVRGKFEDCMLSSEFSSWFKEIISGEQEAEKLEDAGEWFKLKALEVNEALFRGAGADKKGKKEKKGWF
ncbi:hypothetical protein BDZ91DRAFT_712779 [Kalaharituber pfeilii]|nr:hypothetical protein BDZ91DRAFT_712779 [Kalaharituber pfeilii]